MKLSKFSDYALRVSLYLAASNDRLVSISEIVSAYDLSKNNLMKVVNVLVDGGILESVRGRNGGVRLARPAEKIGVGEVVRIMEGDTGLVDCTGCLLASGCGLVRILRDGKRAFYKALNDYSLADAVTLNPRSLAVLQSAAQAELACNGIKD